MIRSNKNIGKISFLLFLKHTKFFINFVRKTTKNDDQPDLKFCAIFYKSKHTINSCCELLGLMTSLVRESIQRVVLIRS